MGLAKPKLQTEHASSQLRGPFTTDVVVWQLLWLLLTQILLQTQKVKQYLPLGSISSKRIKRKRTKKEMMMKRPEIDRFRDVLKHHHRSIFLSSNWHNATSYRFWDIHFFEGQNFGDHLGYHSRKGRRPVLDRHVPSCNRI